MSYFRTQPGVPTQTMVTFGEWLPDDDRNIRPGFPVQWESGSEVPLQDAKNVIYTGSSYRPFQPPVSIGTELPVTPMDAIGVMYNGSRYLIAGSGAALYYSTDGGATWNACGSGFTGAGWVFAQYGNCVYATNGVNPIQTMDLSAGSPTFTALNAASAPVAFAIGIIRDFVVAGNIVSGDQTGGWVLQWSALANPAKWDLPNTQAARADQSGAQSLYSQYGAVQFIAQGEEMAVVFQETGISRVQYVGGDVVFSFYTFERKRGLVTPRAAAQAGNTVYYLAADGFYATDGSTVEPIGYGKINKYFLNNCTDITAVRASMDTVNSCVIWSYPVASGTAQVIYNYTEKKWTRGAYSSGVLFQLIQGLAWFTPAAFNASNFVTVFSGTPTDCELTTKDFRFDPSAHALVTSVRVLCDGTATAGVAGRNQDTDAQNFVGYLTPETISRAVSVRADGYMHAVNVKMTGAFTYCQGVGMEYALRGSR